MDKTDKIEPVEKDQREREKSGNDRHQSFQRDRDVGPPGDKQAESERGVDRQRPTDRHQGFQQNEVNEATKVEEQKRPGVGEIPRAEELSKAGEEPFRKDLTRAGHSFQEHGSRTTGIWEKPQGNPETLNRRGQANLDGIVNSQDTEWVARHHAKRGDIVEGRLPDGRGARWSADGKRFHGFLDP